MFPFSSFSESSRRLSPGQLQAMLSIYQQDLLTGLIRLTSSQKPEESVILIYVDGSVVGIYQKSALGIVCHPVETKNMILPKIDVDLHAYQFSSAFVRPLLAIFEQQQIVSSQQIPTESVLGTIAQIGKNPEAALIHVRWPNAESFILLPGYGLPARQQLFWSQNQVMIMPNLARWTEAECLLTAYTGDAAGKAWGEIYLILAYDFLYERVFSRYDELAGESLVRRLEDQLTAASRTQAWKIAFFSRTVEDTHFFLSQDERVNAYRILLQAGQRQMKAVVGEKLFVEAVQSAYSELPSIFKTALQRNGILKDFIL